MLQIAINYNYLHANVRSSHLEVFCEKGVLKNFAKFTKKHLCQSLFWIKLQPSGLYIYWKRDSGTGIFLWILLNKNTFFNGTHPEVVFSMFSFELFSVISKAFVDDFEHVFICWGRYRITTAILREKPYPANKFLLKVNNRNPKTRRETC